MRWAEGEKFTGSWANDYSGFFEYNSVDGGNERRALRVMFEIVAAALGGASKLAAPNLRLGSSRSDPSVAPGTEHAGSDGGGVVLVHFLQHIVKNDPSEVSAGSAPSYDTGAR